MSLFARQQADFDIDDRTDPYQDEPGVVGSPWHLPRIKQGSTTVFQVDLFLPDGVTPANVSGGAYTFRAQWRSRDRSAKLQAEGVVTVVTSSRIEVRIEAAEAASMTSERGRWDCEVEYDDGGTENHRDTFLFGSYGLDLEITR
ncbi:MAG: hypothetical protein GY719_23660 [bacterium]|nr:hypothetical protein [bacterium]